jgi:hypothetical protein
MPDIPETCKMHNKYDNDSEPVYDGHGFYLTRVCKKCRTAKLSIYRLDIFDKYEADEPLYED